MNDYYYSIASSIAESAFDKWRDNRKIEAIDEIRDDIGADWQFIPSGTGMQPVAPLKHSIEEFLKAGAIGTSCVSAYHNRIDHIRVVRDQDESFPNEPEGLTGEETVSLYAEALLAYSAHVSMDSADQQARLYISYVDRYVKEVESNA